MAKNNIDYQKLSTRLDEVLAKIQSADVSVDEAVALHKEGVELIAALEEYLKGAELKINKIKV